MIVNKEQITVDNLTTASKKNYEDVLNDCVTCPICTDIFQNPMECGSCNGTVCSACQTEQCAFCRARSDTKPNKSIIKVLDKLKFVCKQKNNGCQQELAQSNIDDHLKLCDQAFKKKTKFNDNEKRKRKDINIKKWNKSNSEESDEYELEQSNSESQSICESDNISEENIHEDTIDEDIYQESGDEYYDVENDEKIEDIRFSTDEVQNIYKSILVQPFQINNTTDSQIIDYFQKQIQDFKDQQLDQNKSLKYQKNQSYQSEKYIIYKHEDNKQSLLFGKQMINFDSIFSKKFKKSCEFKFTQEKCTKIITLIHGCMCELIRTQCFNQYNFKKSLMSSLNNYNKLNLGLNNLTIKELILGVVYLNVKPTKYMQHSFTYVLTPDYNNIKQKYEIEKNQIQDLDNNFNKLTYQKIKNIQVFKHNFVDIFK